MEIREKLRSMAGGVLPVSHIKELLSTDYGHNSIVYAVKSVFENATYQKGFVQYEYLNLSCFMRRYSCFSSNLCISF